MRISVYALCYNEATILPAFLDYYSSFCDKIVIYDNGSNDGSQAIVKNHPIAKLKHFESDGLNDIINAEILNNCWKADRDKYDWVICVDMDEFLYCKKGTKDFLQWLNYIGMTIVKPQGWGIADNHTPIDGIDWFEQYPRGFVFPPMDKPVCFNPKKIDEINYGMGHHNASPTGELKWYISDGYIKLLHFKQLSFDYWQAKNKSSSTRLSPVNLKNNWGSYYLDWDKLNREEFENGLLTLKKYNEEVH